ncbi:MAG TPA: TetR/AcrR family transcriptional regulator [Streptosporangiaceae bacterium]|nr:TetR/AcrR family transcriptional regulator [Streptosporangiaceae bacterium]
METPVKGRNSYDTTGRQTRTRLTRAAVVEAARVLFLARGYAATTIETISEMSDTPVATVYRLFSSKLGILRALLDVSAVGDDEAVAMGDRPSVRTLLEDQDPRNQLVGFAGLARDVMSGLAPVHQILVSAAGSDSEAAELLDEHTRQRQEGQGRIARSLARVGALRPKLREREAADIIHALMSPEVYLLLVSDRGWSPERYEDWLGGTLISQLLPPSSD